MESFPLAKYELLGLLKQVALSDPVLAINSNSNAASFALLDRLGICSQNGKKPCFKGIIINTQTRKKATLPNRVNLFAQVPDWTISTCKASKDILRQYGYCDKNGDLRLYCTVSALRPNSQFLQLKVTESLGILAEEYTKNDIVQNIANWKLSKLAERLIETHPSSVWVTAVEQKINGKTYFHFREAEFTGAPNVTMLPILLSQGTITLDHEISIKNGRVSEKGPLFKINPLNLSILFTEKEKYNLMQ